MTATISSKGQVTIPKAIREHLGLKPGSKVDFVSGPSGVELVVSDPGATIRKTAGALHKYVKKRAHLPRESDDAILTRVAQEIARAGRRR